jgi:transposase
VELSSRDRSSEYAAAARQAAPQACQVADRFHLLRNLREVALRVFRRHAKLVERVAAPGTAGGAASSLTRLRLDREASREKTRTEMAARFRAIQQLAHDGMSPAAIARTLGLNWQTVHKYAAYARPPERRHTSRQPSVLTPYQGSLLGRWASGCRNARQLWRELVAEGYPGSYRHVARLTGYLRHQERMGAGLPTPPAGMTPAQATGLVVARPEKRTAGENKTLEHLGKLHPEIQTVLTLFASFAALVRERSPSGPAAKVKVDEWLVHARASQVPEIAAFALKLGQDLEAVLASLTLSYRQGQTEGQVNRLKLLKRSMYGRAKPDLLRQRMLQKVVG